jgi:hypothetical protein
MLRSEYEIVVAAAGLGVVGLCSIPTAIGLVSQLVKREKKQEIYEDEDGKATAESVKAFSNGLSRFLMLLFAAGGTAISIVLGVISPSHLDKFLENWLNVGAWVRFVTPTPPSHVEM